MKFWVESELGKGSQFYFNIPYDIDTQARQAAVHENSAGMVNYGEKLSGLKVLLAEDNAFNAIVVQEELKYAIKGVRVTVS